MVELKTKYEISMEPDKEHVYRFDALQCNMLQSCGWLDLLR